MRHHIICYCGEILCLKGLFITSLLFMLAPQKIREGFLALLPSLMAPWMISLMSMSLNRNSCNLVALSCFINILKRLQHLADTLVSVKAIPDEDKELANKSFFQHLFFLCHKTNKLWSKVRDWLGLKKTMEFYQALLQAFRSCYRGSSKVAKFRIAATIYHIWDKRNRQLFDGEDTDLDAILKKIQILIHRTHILDQCVAFSIDIAGDLGYDSHICSWRSGDIWIEIQALGCMLSKGQCALHMCTYYASYSSR